MGKIIYLISFLDKFGNTSLLFELLSMAALFFGGLFYLHTTGTLDGSEEKLIKRFLKVAGVFFIISLVVTMLIPSKEEMYMMALTKDYEVEDVYRMTKEEIKGSIDYVFNRIKELEDE
ncbi:hypothetical protein NH288_05500 [Anaerococcus sp. NML200537]|uniref:hypothetical protein n=1 Tax=Anaerococcus sp. NML200537 TaxID=2954485 RepID=UPI0022385700|nr:hypothetical protein [Anaerococcus sp. NML200537]MCW6701538.1 hypothetical protein [Anaerococcus sp. NML200537]